MADESDEIALASRFDPQHAEAVLGIVERDTVDEARQDLRRAHPRRQHHARMMDAEMRGFQNSFNLVTQQDLAGARGRNPARQCYRSWAAKPSPERPVSVRLNA